ncbi:MAG: NAD(P)H-dependent oxidoreductase [Verrucomicrobiota bacterium]
MKVLVLLAHPEIEASHSNARLLAAIEGRERVTVHQLYAAYPDWQIDVAREQALLLGHDRIVFQFPLYWYSTPPLLKKWQDDVLTMGWAYGEGGTKLNGKELLIATSIGGHPDVYRAGGRNHFTMSEILRPLQATANICGMHYLPPFVVGGHLDEAGLTATAQDYAAYITNPKPRGLA